LLTRVEIGHIRIGSAGNRRFRSRGSAPHTRLHHLAETSTETIADGRLRGG
jgi:hypothetical protein